MRYEEKLRSQIDELYVNGTSTKMGTFFKTKYILNINSVDIPTRP